MRRSKTKEAKSAAAIRAGERLRAARKARGWSVAELSDAAGGGLLPSRISNYEQGLRELPIDVAEKLAGPLATPSAYLMGLIDETDRDLLSFPPDVRANALSTLNATVLAAREHEPAYNKPKAEASPRVRTPAIVRAQKKADDDGR